jgi:hypothetical protein
MQQARKGHPQCRDIRYKSARGVAVQLVLKTLCDWIPRVRMGTRGASCEGGNEPFSGQLPQLASASVSWTDPRRSSVSTCKPSGSWPAGGLVRASIWVHIVLIKTFRLC